ncbi:MAG: DUF2147 domain-containing protein [Hyphomicrobium sp.]
MTHFPASAAPRRLAFAVLSALSVSSAAEAAEPGGVWLNDTGRGAIEIKACGEKLCGHVVWVKDSADTHGCGKQIIGDVVPSGSGRWGNGWIYSPEKKRRYDVELKPLESGKLSVTGYAGVRFLSRTMIWTKAPDTIARCGTDAKAATAAQPAPQASGSVATSPPTPTGPSSSAAQIGAPAAKTKAATAEPITPAAKPADAPPAPKVTEAPANDAPASDETDTAEAEDDAKDAPKAKGLRIGNIDLEKVLRRSADGTCKLDLPWVKVRFDCDG